MTHLLFNMKQIPDQPTCHYYGNKEYKLSVIKRKVPKSKIIF